MENAYTTIHNIGDIIAYDADAWDKESGQYGSIIDDRIAEIETQNGTVVLTLIGLFRIKNKRWYQFEVTDLRRNEK